eukprot:2513228-Rhodomonas_salina.4
MSIMLRVHDQYKEGIMLHAQDQYKGGYDATHTGEYGATRASEHAVSAGARMVLRGASTRLLVNSIGFSDRTWDRKSG